MTLLFKQIKPRRFNSEAFAAQIAKAIKEVGELVKKDFESTTATWEHRVAFEVLTQLNPPTVFVGTDDEIYGYVDQGTRPHPIFPVNAKALAFASDFVPKSTPGVIGSGPGMRGAVDTFRPYVQHPGGRAMGFTKTITEKWRPRFRTKMHQAMRNAAQASGHAI